MARRATAEKQREPQPWDDDYRRPPIRVFAEDFSDEDIEKFYEETISGSGGPPPPGRVQDLVTQYFLWDGKSHDDGVFTAEDHQTAFETMKLQVEDQTWITYGGVKQQSGNDNREWVWLAADKTCVGLCLQIFKSIPYGRRPLLVAKHNKTDVMFEKVNWAKVEERLDKEIGTVVATEEDSGARWLEEYGFSADVFKTAIANFGAGDGQQGARRDVAPPPVAQVAKVAPPPVATVKEVEVAVESGKGAPVESGGETVAPGGPEISSAQMAAIEELCCIDGERMLEGSGLTTWEALRDRLRTLTTGQLKRINEARSLDSGVPKSQKLDNLLEFLRAA